MRDSSPAQQRVVPGQEAAEEAVTEEAVSEENDPTLDPFRFFNSFDLHADMFRDIDEKACPNSIGAPLHSIKGTWEDLRAFTSQNALGEKIAAIEAKSRRALEAYGCPPCIPESVPLGQLSGDDRRISHYWQWATGCGPLVLSAQLRKWELFRSDLAIKRGECRYMRLRPGTYDLKTNLGRYPGLLNKYPLDDSSNSDELSPLQTWMEYLCWQTEELMDLRKARVKICLAQTGDVSRYRYNLQYPLDDYSGGLQRDKRNDLADASFKGLTSALELLDHIYRTELVLADWILKQLPKIAAATEETKD